MLNNQNSGKSLLNVYQQRSASTAGKQIKVLSLKLLLYLIVLSGSLVLMQGDVEGASAPNYENRTYRRKSKLRKQKKSRLSVALNSNPILRYFIPGVAAGVMLTLWLVSDAQLMAAIYRNKTTANRYIAFAMVSLTTWLCISCVARIRAARARARGVRYVGNRQLDFLDAAELDDASGDEGEEGGVGDGSVSANAKMVLCVNNELKMGKGKIGAQCGHAAVGAVEQLQRNGLHAQLRAWRQTGQTKIAVKLDTEEEMDSIAKHAQEAGVPFFLVRDAGRTQIAAGSRTVLALGPADAAKIDSVTSHLKLL